jgi:NAD(P)-dependent dehydrogenase (short-subunit alcohol dehydrogenase family)
MMHSFQDKVVLITGGSSGIGRGLALKLGQLGSRVAIAARNPKTLDAVADEIQAAKAASLAVPTDVTDPEQCRQAVEKVVNRFGRLDILVNCAGLSMRAYFAGSDLTAMEQVMRVNYFGTLYMTHHALPHIKVSKGSLVALSSLTGLRGIPSYSVYGASKFAVQGLYESLRLELKHDGVHVGIVAPGFVATPLRQNVLGPDGRPWDHPPRPPFRIWPVEKCVNSIIRLIRWRRAQINLPWFMAPLFWLDQIVGRTIGNAILRYAFPPV